MYDLLAGAGRDWETFIEGKPTEGRLRPRILSRDGEPMTVGNGVRVTPDGSFDDCRTPHVVCVPELNVTPDAALSPTTSPPRSPGCGAGTTPARRSPPRARALCCWQKPACSTAIPPPRIGRTATSMQERHPRVDVQGHRALVVAGEGQRLLMAGGGASWMDMALFLIARLLGVEAAVRVARLNLIDWHDIGQQPFASLARSRQQDDALIGEIQAWIGENYGVRSPVAAMAARSGLPERSFDRRFRKATGMSPLEYVHTLRLEEAKQQLEATQLPIEAIAGECGYEDAGYFSRLFAKRVGLTPAQYRRRFGKLRQVLAPVAEATAQSSGEP